MSKLHELLAVEEDRKGQASKIIDEAKKTFRDKQEHFEKTLLTFNPSAENAVSKEEGKTDMVTTVTDKLKYVSDIVTPYLDVQFQKELTNTEAKSDIILEDGTVLAEKVPATALLGIERELKKLSDLYNAVPTLEPRVFWAKDEEEGKGFKLTIDKRDRTKKKPVFQTVAPATKEHKAQVVQTQEDVFTGVIETKKWSSKLTSAEKSNMLERLDNLKAAVKKARMRANCQIAKRDKIGRKIFDYINSNKIIKTS